MMNFMEKIPQELKTRPMVRRACNIALRTAHIAVTCVLLGGHYFGIDAGQLHAWLYATLATGAALAAVEAYPDWRWCCELRAWMIFAKILLMVLIPWFWDYRFLWLLAILALGSTGSHMPKKARYYQVIPCRDFIPSEKQ